MIIFMAGYPAAGKSFVVDQFTSKLPDELDVLVINPKELRPENYATLDEDQKREENLTAWEASLDCLDEKIKSLDPSKIVVYDTACASLANMRPRFELAKQHGHKVIYVFVQADEEIRETRAVERLPKPVLEKYDFNFSESTPVLAKLADRAIVVQNFSNEGLPRVSKIVRDILWLLNLQTQQVTQ